MSLSYYKQYNKNRMSNKPLRLSDKDVFPEGKKRFSLSNRDRDKAVYFTGVKKHKKEKK